jgi:2-polyprenyl-3-methyl-5-hydroxy-6-metoxy-1,4-benzoquinol methylase
MTQTVAKSLQRIAPSWLKGAVPSSVKDWMFGSTTIDLNSLTSADWVRQLMLRYQTKNLVHTDAASFRKEMDRYLHLEDAAMEGYADPSQQRDLSIKFHWAFNHDFGDFYLPGRLGDRHITLISTILDWFPVLPKDLAGVRVMDVGCWSGSVSLLLAAMGANVVGIEEVRKYIDCLNYLKFAFALTNLEARNLSLFECDTEDLADSFDYVLFAGVLYHVTDPVIALRTAYNCLKDGGTCIVETAIQHSKEQTLSYEGPGVTFDGDRRALSRSGWNWFLPSPSTLRQMMADTGFVDVRLSPVLASSRGHRIYAAGRRDRHSEITRAGLSMRKIR